MSLMQYRLGIHFLTVPLLSLPHGLACFSVISTWEEVPFQGTPILQLSSLLFASSEDILYTSNNMPYVLATRAMWYLMSTFCIMTAATSRSNFGAPRVWASRSLSSCILCMENHIWVTVQVTMYQYSMCIYVLGVFYTIRNAYFNSLISLALNFPCLPLSWIYHSTFCELTELGYNQQTWINLMASSVVIPCSSFG